MTLARPLKPNIHYYEITVTAANKAAGPKSSIIIRFFPVTQDETVIVKTTNFARFDENSFIDELGQLIEEQSTVVINDMKNVLDSDGNPINEVKRYLKMLSLNSQLIHFFRQKLLFMFGLVNVTLLLLIK